MSRLVPLVFLALLVSTANAASRAEELSVRVVAHPQVKGTQIPRAVLASIFLKQAQRWGDGSPVSPVDQSVKSPVRTRFTGQVLERTLLEVQMYWQKKIGYGLTPPPVKGSDQEVLAYVAATPGAIGYVALETPLTVEVKALEVTD